jgi:hypothetical protein
MISCSRPAQRGLDGQLQLGRHLKLVGHGADDAGQRRAARWSPRLRITERAPPL